MGVLGKVTGDLEGPRGPDVSMQVIVPIGWFGREVSVALPRNLHCAACDGGGCDGCHRAGAISLREKKDEPVEIRVSLPAHDPEVAGICLRIPGQGGKSQDEELGRGHLLLSVKTGDEPSSEVTLVDVPAPLSDEERRLLMKRSLVMAVGLIALFLGMLKLSGWL